MADKQRYCRKCLLREMEEGESFKTMYRYIDSLAEENKAETGLYEQRLAFCKQCDYLLNGMCRLCGCYVEMRAAMKIRGCPSIPSKWEAVPL